MYLHNFFSFFKLDLVPLNCCWATIIGFFFSTSTVTAHQCDARVSSVMDLCMCLAFLIIFVVLFVLWWKLFASLDIPKSLRSSYTNPGKFTYANLIVSQYFRKFLIIKQKIGPWYLLKIIAARIWLSRKLKENPRVLNNIIDDDYNKVDSKGYNQIGRLVPTNVEIAWEQPHPLKLMTVKTMYLLSF